MFTHMSRPLVVVEAGPEALEDARGELASRGWADVVGVVVEDDPSAARAVLAALEGRALLVDARADRDVLDRLCDDLRRLGHLDHRVAPTDLLTAEQHALLELLAAGATLGEAAERLHLSRRSADRRLAAAREVLAAPTTGAAVASYRRRLQRLPEPPT